MDSQAWTVIYLGWLLATIAGYVCGYRACWYVYKYQRIKLIQRWRLERRKHRQKRPWVKHWMYKVRLSSYKWTKAEYGRMINTKTKPLAPNMIKEAAK